MKTNRLIALSVFCLSFVWGFATAAAETDASGDTRLDTVVVTAEKEHRDLERVPVSVSAVTETTIKDGGITGIQDFSRLIPNLYVANWGIRGTSYAFIRGIGSVNNEPAIGFYVDDVAVMDARGFDSPLYDIERIEVLRGPQSTLYGRNAIAGVVNIITKKPDNETRCGVSYTAGNFHLNRADGFVRAPIVADKLYFGLSVAGEARDGYTENDYLKTDVDDRRSLNARSRIRWTPAPELDVSLSVDWEQLRDGAFPLGELESLRDRPWHASFDTEGAYERDSSGTSLRVVWDAPGFSLTSLSSVRDFDDMADNDQDFTAAALMTAEEEIDDRQYSQELRFASADDGRPVKWMAGCYGYFREKDHDLWMYYEPGVMLTTASVSQLYRSEYTTRGGDLFGQLTWTIGQRFDLTAGLRYDYEKGEIDHVTTTWAEGFSLGESVIDASDSSGAWLPKFQAACRINPDIMIYTGASRGYRSGGFNTAYEDPADIRFDAEFSWNYETGIKSVWFSDRLTVNADVFFIELEDQQVTQLLSSANTVIRNAGKSRSRGIEVETRALLAHGLTLDAGIGYTDAEFREYTDPVSGADYSGNQAMIAPKYNFSLALGYWRPLTDDWNLNVRSELNGVGDFYWDTANSLEQDAYALVNLSAGLESDQYDLVFWARNLLDEEYEAVAFAFTESVAVGQSGDPLTAGVTFRMRY